ncbi:ALK and LTK ligand 2 isoform X1 [Symphalangus syndactylus]|uniref:ALK and LTK ligand 2 isoform X1 n=1 Tax=Symphalangus syndactylus TaxID=9590 RepID=UPI0030074842
MRAGATAGRRRGFQHVARPGPALGSAPGLRRGLRGLGARRRPPHKGDAANLSAAAGPGARRRVFGERWERRRGPSEVRLRPGSCLAPAASEGERKLRPRQAQRARRTRPFGRKLGGAGRAGGFRGLLSAAAAVAPRGRDLGRDRRGDRGPFTCRLAPRGPRSEPSSRRVSESPSPAAPSARCADPGAPSSWGCCWCWGRRGAAEGARSPGSRRTDRRCCGWWWSLSRSCGSTTRRSTRACSSLGGTAPWAARRRRGWGLRRSSEWKLFLEI